MVEKSSLSRMAVSRGSAPVDPYFLATNEYGTYCVPKTYKGREVPNVLRAGQVYEAAMLAYLRRHIGAHDVITGGAFVGDFLPALHEVLAPDAMLHTFEPFPMSFEACAYTLALNGLDRCVLHPCAVGAEAATLPLAIGRGARQDSLAAGMHLIEADAAAAGNVVTVDVDVRPIDDLVAEDRRVSLLHLDVEGFEVSALRGAARIIGANRPIVVAEGIKPRKQAEMLAAVCAAAPEAEYRIVGAIDKNTIFRPLADLPL